MKIIYDQETDTITVIFKESAIKESSRSSDDYAVLLRETLNLE